MQQMRKLQDQLEDTITKSFDKKREDRIASVVDQQIKTLSQEKQLSDADQARLTELTAQITEHGTTLTLFEQLDAKQKEIDQATAERNQITTELNTQTVKDDVADATQELDVIKYPKTENILIASGRY